MKRITIILSMLWIASLACAVRTPTPSPTTPGSMITAAPTEAQERTETPRTGATGASHTKPPTNTPQSAPELCHVVSEALHLRVGPGVDYAVLDWLEAGETLTIISRADGWLEVTTTAGRAGWIKEEYCK